MPPQLGTPHVTVGTCHAGDVLAGVVTPCPLSPLAELAQQPPARAPEAPPPEALPAAMLGTLAMPDTTVAPPVPVRPAPTGATDPRYYTTWPRQRTIFIALAATWAGGEIRGGVATGVARLPVLSGWQASGARPATRHRPATGRRTSSAMDGHLFGKSAWVTFLRMPVSRWSGA